MLYFIQVTSTVLHRGPLFAEIPRQIDTLLPYISTASYKISASCLYATATINQEYIWDCNRISRYIKFVFCVTRLFSKKMKNCDKMLMLSLYVNKRCLCLKNNQVQGYGIFYELL